jgi:quercetin dioxygenase-like cupin family protein
VQNGNLVISPLTREHSEIRAFKVVYPPSGGVRPQRQTHPGSEWLYVLSGELWLQLDEQEHTLTRGEAAEFDTEIPHALAAAGSEPTEVISIFNAAGERMHVHLPLE